MKKTPKAKKKKQPEPTPAVCPRPLNQMVCADCGVIITEEEQQRDSYKTKPAGVYHHYSIDTCIKNGGPV